MFNQHESCVLVRQSYSFKRHLYMMIIGIIFFLIGLFGIVMYIINRSENGMDIMFIFFIVIGHIDIFLYMLTLRQMTKDCESGTVYKATYSDVSIKMLKNSFRIILSYVDRQGIEKTIASYPYFGWLDIEKLKHQQYEILVVPSQKYAMIIKMIKPDVL